jgi:hypothetical protein
MNAEIDTTDNKTIIRTTLKDYTSKDADTLDVVIEITADGIEIRPANDEDLHLGKFHREVWVEFYCSQLRTIIWDGTQEDPVIQHVLLEKGP